jgi:hypothetical protein
MSVDVSKLAFDSTFRYERIATKGSATFGAIVPFGTQTVTISHNLGYVPYVKSWYTYGGKIFDLFAGIASFDIDGNGGQIDNSYVTSSDFVVTIINFGAGNISGTIYYRIYAEPQQ